MSGLTQRRFRDRRAFYPNDNPGFRDDDSRFRAIWDAIRELQSVGGSTGDLVIDGVTYPVKQAAITASASGDTPVVPAVGGKKIRVVALIFAVAGDVAVGWKSGATVLVNPMSFSATGGMEDNRMPFGYFAETAIGAALNINLSAAVAVNGSLNYIEF